MSSVSLYCKYQVLILIKCSRKRGWKWQIMLTDNMDPPPASPPPHSVSTGYYYMNVGDPFKCTITYGETNVHSTGTPGVFLLVLCLMGRPTYRVSRDFYFFTGAIWGTIYGIYCFCLTNSQGLWPRGFYRFYSAYTDRDPIFTVSPLLEI